MILSTNQVLFASNVQLGKTLIKSNLEDEIQSSIRRGFDNCTTDHYAQAHIEIAIELGFKDLAEEMMLDLEDGAQRRYSA